MKFNIRKIIVRIAVISTIFGIMSYIFWPQSKESVELITTTTSEPLEIADPPCLVLYQKNTDLMVEEDPFCIGNFQLKYSGALYAKLKIVCRSSSDGQNIDRADLSEKRLKALMFDLMNRGVPFEDLVGVSLGDTSPYPGVDPNSEDGKILNRSCEVIGLKE